MRTIFKHLQVQIMCLLICTGTAFATDFYHVDGETGNDNNTGTEEYPLKTIGKALELADSGDTIIVYPSVYEECVVINENVTIQSSEPENWEKIQNTVIKTTGIFATVAFTQNAPSATLRGFRVENDNLYGIYAISGGSPVIENCDITGLEYGIFSLSSTSTIIKNCKISDCNVYGIYFNGGEPVVKNCWIYDNNHSGIMFQSVANANIHNNTIVQNGKYGIFRAMPSGNPPLHIRNCIIWGHEKDLKHRFDLPNMFDAKYCCISTPGDVGDPCITHNITSDPCFTAPDHNEFFLRSNSLCIDKGDPYASYSGEMDIDFQHREDEDPNFGRVDIGADELYWSKGDDFNPKDVPFPGFDPSNYDEEGAILTIYCDCEDDHAFWYAVTSKLYSDHEVTSNGTRISHWHSNCELGDEGCPSTECVNGCWENYYGEIEGLEKIADAFINQDCFTYAFSEALKEEASYNYFWYDLSDVLDEVELINSGTDRDAILNDSTHPLQPGDMLTLFEISSSGVGHATYIADIKNDIVVERWKYNESPIYEFEPTDPDIAFWDSVWYYPPPHNEPIYVYRKKAQ